MKFRHFKSYIDVPAVVQALALPVGSVTNDRVWCKCVNPGHEDRNPSMQIKIDGGDWICWGCRMNGDIASLVMQVMNVGFGEAVDWLKEVSGIEELTIEDVLNDIDANMQLVGKHDSSGLVSIGRLGPARDSYKPITLPLGTQLWSTEVLEFMASKGILSDYIRPYFHVGYCPLGQYKSRVIIPIWFNQQLVDFQARDYTGESQRKDLFVYGIPIGQFLFNHDNIDWSQPVAVVESPLDVFRVFPYYTNVVAVFGSNLGMNQAQLLSKATSLLVYPDFDSGGKHLLQEMQVRFSTRTLGWSWFNKTDIPGMIKSTVYTAWKEGTDGQA
jgi:hypothetical protein